MSPSDDRVAGLRVVKGEGDPTSETLQSKRSKPANPLRPDRRARLERDIARGEALVDGLDLIAAAYDTAGPDLAIDRACQVAARLGDDVEHLHRVIAVLAVEAVWVMPPMVETPRTADQMFRRKVQLRIWAEERRQKIVAALRTGRRVLRGKP